MLRFTSFKTVFIVHTKMNNATAVYSKSEHALSVIPLHMVQCETGTSFIRQNKKKKTKEKVYYYHLTLKLDLTSCVLCVTVIYSCA